MMHQVKSRKSLRERLGVTNLTRDEEDALFVSFCGVSAIWFLVWFWIADRVGDCPDCMDWISSFHLGVPLLVVFIMAVLPPGLLCLVLFSSSDDDDVGKRKYWHTR